MQRKPSAERKQDCSFERGLLMLICHIFEAPIRLSESRKTRSVSWICGKEEDWRPKLGSTYDCLTGTRDGS